MLISSFAGYSSRPVAGFGYVLGKTQIEAALQNALNVLATVVNDPAIGVTVDGVVGPGTAKAYNRAAKKYLTTAPAKGRTGKLSVSIVKKFADRFVGFIKAELAKRGAPTVAPAPTPTPAEEKAPIPAKAAAALTLQKALRSLGAQRNDQTLMIKADGLVGTNTRKAVNRAMTRYVKNAPAGIRTGKLSTSTVKNSAAQLAVYIEEAILLFKAAPVPTPTPTPTPRPEPVLVSRTQVKEMQSALRALAPLTKDAILRIAADGIVGPRTAKAVNRALSQYIRDRGGFKLPLTVTQVKQQVPNLAAVFLTEIQRRKGAVQPTLPTPTPTAPAPAPTARVNVARMQRNVTELGKLVKDSALSIRADGIVGPKTTKAVNRAFAKYVRGGPSSLRQTLSVAQVNALADEISTTLTSEISRRLSEAKPPKPTPPEPEPEPRRPPIQPTDVSPAPAPRREEVFPRREEPTDLIPAPPVAAKKTNWPLIVGIGVGGLALGGLAFMAFRKSPRAATA